MEKTGILKLKRNYRYIVANLELRDSPVLDYLYQEDVLSEDDIQRIKAEVTTQDMVRMFLSILPKRTADAYKKLLEAFHEANVQFIANKLEQTEITPDEVDNMPDSVDFGPRNAFSKNEILHAIQAELSQRYIEHFERCDPLPWIGEMVVSLPEVYTELQITERDTYRNRARGGASVRLDKIFECHKQHTSPRRIYLQGMAGMGKTVICNKLAYDWATRRENCSVGKFKIVLFLELKEGIAKENITDTVICQLFPVDFKYSRESILNCLQEYQSEILLILDGYDELSREDKKGVDSFLQGKHLHQVHCFLTSRPTKLAAKYFDQRLKCAGFTPEKFKEFVGKAFKEKGSEFSQGLFDRVANSCYLRQLAENPLNCFLLCVHWEGNEGNFPHSLSQLFFDIMNIIVLRYRSKQEIYCPTDGLEDGEDILSGLKELAFKSITENRREVSLKEIRQVPHHEDILKIGLLQRNQPTSPLSTEELYSFTQSNIQEMLAAMYTPKLSAEERNRRFVEFLAHRKTAILVIFMMGVFKGDNLVLKDLFNLLAENNYKSCDSLNIELYNLSGGDEEEDESSAATLMSFNKMTRPFTISFHALNEAESKQKFLSTIAASMPKNLFLDLKCFRNHFKCHDLSHSCFMVLESMPCPERVMLMELSYFAENKSVEAVNSILAVLKHVAVKDPNQFELLIYCDGLNFEGFRSIPFFLRHLNDCMTHRDEGQFFEKRVKSVNFLLPDCYRLRDMNYSELENGMKLEACRSDIKFPPLVVYTDVKCDHVATGESETRMCPTKMAAHIFQKINPEYDIKWKRAVLPTDFIQELY